MHEIFENFIYTVGGGYGLFVFVVKYFNADTIISSIGASENKATSKRT